MAVVDFGYWDTRGKGEPIRLMMEYLGVSYREKRYTFGDAPEFSKGDFTSVKNQLGIKFPNLPYLIDGEVKISESFAIMRYLARKHKQLYPQTDEENLKCDVLQGVIYDFRAAYTKTIYDRENFEQAKGNYLREFEEKMPIFEDILSKTKWLTGENLMYVDFWFSENMSCLQMCFPGCLDKYPNVKRYCDKFEALERIAAYKKSERFQKLPILSKRAVGIWGKKE